MKIPREIWGFCVEQIKLYPLNEGAYHETLKEIKLRYEEGGLTSPLDQSGVITYSGTSPITARYENQELMLNDPYLRYLSRCVSVMDIVQRGIDENVKTVLDAIWENGWRDNGLIANKSRTSVATVKRAKHEIIRRVAAGWGLW